MRSWSVEHVFRPELLDLWDRATSLVSRIPWQRFYGEDLRCHEIARAVQTQLYERARNSHILLNIEDGKFDAVDHSWLECLGGVEARPVPGPAILDCYAVGAMPMVQLLDASAWMIRGRSKLYTRGNCRTDIRVNVIAAILDSWKPTEQRPTDYGEYEGSIPSAFSGEPARAFERGWKDVKR